MNKGQYIQLAFPFADDWSLTKEGVKNIKRMAKELADDIDAKILDKLMNEYSRSTRNN